MITRYKFESKSNFVIDYQAVKFRSYIFCHRTTQTYLYIFSTFYCAWHTPGTQQIFVDECINGRQCVQSTTCAKKQYVFHTGIIRSPYEITLICCLWQRQRSISEADGPFSICPFHQKDANVLVRITH